MHNEDSIPLPGKLMDQNTNNGWFLCLRETYFSYCCSKTNYATGDFSLCFIGHIPPW